MDIDPQSMLFFSISINKVCPICGNKKARAVCVDVYERDNSIEYNYKFECSKRHEWHSFFSISELCLIHNRYYIEDDKKFYLKCNG